jgi:hypothetical protein
LEEECLFEELLDEFHYSSNWSITIFNLPQVTVLCTKFKNIPNKSYRFEYSICFMSYKLFLYMIHFPDKILFMFREYCSLYAHFSCARTTEIFEAYVNNNQYWLKGNFLLYPSIVVWRHVTACRYSTHSRPFDIAWRCAVSKTLAILFPEYMYCILW